MVRRMSAVVMKITQLDQLLTKKQKNVQCAYPLPLGKLLTVVRPIQGLVGRPERRAVKTVQAQEENAVLTARPSFA